MSEAPRRADSPALWACALLTLLLGSIHAFSVLMAPLEQHFDASRSQVSLSYSLALLSLTAAVLLGHRWFFRWSPATLTLGVGAGAALACACAALSTELWQFWISYSLCFGFLNGLGYGYALQLSARAHPRRPGLAMGITTACYALGAVLSPLGFEWAVVRGGHTSALWAWRWPCWQCHR